MHVWFATGSELALVCKVLSTIIFTEDQVRVFVILLDNSASLCLTKLTVTLKVMLSLTLTLKNHNSNPNPNFLEHQRTRSSATAEKVHRQTDRRTEGWTH